MALFRFAQQHAEAHASFAVASVAELMQTDQLSFFGFPVFRSDGHAR